MVLDLSYCEMGWQLVVNALLVFIRHGLSSHGPYFINHENMSMQFRTEYIHSFLRSALIRYEVVYLRLFKLRVLNVANRDRRVGSNG